MASLCQKPRSPFWFACFSLPDGRRTKRSTKLTDRKKAQKLADSWEDAVRKRISEAQARRVISDIHEMIHGEKLASPTVDAFRSQWLARKQGEVGVVTLAAYRHALEEFSEAVGDKASQPLHYITAAQIATWRDQSAARATPRTANNKLKILRVFFQSAWRDGLITDNPAAKVSTLKTEASKRRPFTIPELKAILSVASQEWRGMILAGFYTGQRLKDIASLTWSNVDLQTGEIRLSTSKTGRRQIIPIAKPLVTYLETLPAGDDPAAPLFPAAYPFALRAGGSSVLSQAFHGVLADAGLVQRRTALEKHAGKGVGRDAPREKAEISFHSLRHSATSLLKNAGVPEAVAMDSTQQKKSLHRTG